MGRRIYAQIYLDVELFIENVNKSPEILTFDLKNAKVAIILLARNRIPSCPMP